MSKTNENTFRYVTKIFIVFISTQSNEWTLVSRHRILQKCALIGVIKRVVRMSCIPGYRLTIDLQKIKRHNNTQLKIDAKPYIVLDCM